MNCSFMNEKELDLGITKCLYILFQKHFDTTTNLSVE